METGISHCQPALYPPDPDRWTGFSLCPAGCAPWIVRPGTRSLHRSGADHHPPTALATADRHHLRVERFGDGYSQRAPKILAACHCPGNVLARSNRRCVPVAGSVGHPTPGSWGTGRIIAAPECSVTQSIALEWTLYAHLRPAHGGSARSDSSDGSSCPGRGCGSDQFHRQYHYRLKPAGRQRFGAHPGIHHDAHATGSHSPIGRHCRHANVFRPGCTGQN